MSNNYNSLFNITVGEQNATWKALQDAGLTPDGCKTVRKNPDAAAAMVAALQRFLQPVNPHPRRHYDLSAILGLADPLLQINWPKRQLAENQFLVAYRGESPEQILSRRLEKEIYVWERHTQLDWWEQGLEPGIYVVTLPLPDSGGKTLEQHKAFCQPNSITPFALNAALRLAHKELTGECIGGWTRCPELTSSFFSTGLSWDGAQLSCNYSRSVGKFDLDFQTSSFERLSGL